MIGKLQRKFILAAMTAVTILLAVMLGGINFFNIRMARQQSAETLEILVGEYRQPYADQFAGRTQEGGYRDLFFRQIDRDTVDAARYFIVEIDEDEVITHIGLEHISSVDETVAAEYARCVWELHVGSGIVDGFRYDTLWQTPGQAYIFLSLESQNRQIFSVLGMSLIAGLCGWLVMLGLIVLLSRKAIRPIAENIERQKQFITDAGHELKTPLAIIRTNIDALELCTGATKWSRTVREQTVRLDGLMQDMLTLSRAEEGGTMPGMTELDAGRLLRETLEPFYESAAARGVLIEDEISDGVTVTASRAHLARLFSTLLDNAVKYVPSNGLIEVSLRGGKHMTFEVANTCPERPVDDLDRLFDRFYRGDSARTQTSGGYGIGLSAARAIVAAHKGSIRAEYKEGTIRFIVEI